MSKSRLFSGRIKKVTGPDLRQDRYQYIDVSQSEPDLGFPESTGTSFLISNELGEREWTQILTLEELGVTTGTYGSSTTIPVFTVDKFGRLTSATSVDIVGLTPVGITTGTFGDATNIPVITVDEFGRVTSATIVAVIGLTPIDITTGTYGSSTAIPIVTVDIFGRVTSATSVDIIGLTPIGVTTGTYGSESEIPVISIDEFGRITTATSVAVAGVSGFDFSTSTGALTIATANGGQFTATINLSPFYNSDVNFRDVYARDYYVTGTIKGPTNLIIDPFGHGDESGTVTILGNLQVSGTATYINSTILEIGDKNILLASSSTSQLQSDGAGFTVYLGTSTSTSFVYDGVNDVWRLDRLLDATVTNISPVAVGNQPEQAATGTDYLLLYTTTGTLKKSQISNTVFRGDLGYTGSRGFDGSAGYAGSRGDDGTSVKILGTTATATLLPGYPDSYTGNLGDGYIVQDTGNLWVWAGPPWTDVGQIRGYTGSQGNVGYTGSAAVDGAAGLDGYAGSQGDIGYTGSQGERGVAPESIYYIPVSITATVGTYVSGNLASIQTFGDNDFYVVNEVNGVPGWVIEINYEDVVNFNRVELALKYEHTNHVIEYEIYNYNSLSWDVVGNFRGTSLVFASHIFDIISDDSYISGGEVKTRLYHSTSGIANIAVYFDYAAIVLTTQGPEGPTGFTGSQGITGFAGSQGDIGYTGSRGFDGSRGADGSSVTIVGTTATFTLLPGYPDSYIGDVGDGYLTQDDGHLWVWNGSVWTDVGQIRGYTGSEGSQGFTGFDGSQGITGFQGSQGELGYTGSRGYDGSQGETGYAGSRGEVGFTGSRGDPGADGRSVVIVGTVSTFTELPGYPSYSGPAGDGYIAADTGNLWVWTGDAWTDVGKIVGYTGSKGDVGYVGSRGTSSIIVGNTATSSLLPLSYEGLIGDSFIVNDSGNLWVWRGAFWEQVGRVLGYTGSQGEVGFQGSTGYTGSEGYVGSRGYDGSQGESSFVYDDTPPLDPQPGDRWFDAVTGAELVWTYDGDSGQWVEVTASGFVGYTGSQGYGSVNFLTRNYTGDSTSTQFAVTDGLGVDNVFVFENGVMQFPTVDYTITGTNLSFVTAPAAGVAIQIRELSNAGASTLSVLSMQPVTLTTATVGNMEYNGSELYFTPLALQRGLIPNLQYYRLNTTFGGVNATGIQRIFGVGTTLSSSTVYAFHGVFNLLKTIGTTSHTVSTSFGGGATVNNVTYNIIGGDGNGTWGGRASGAAVNSIAINTTASTAITGALTAATQFLWVTVSGTVSINAGGTFIPQYSLSAAPGGTYSTQIGSYFSIYPIGAAGANTSIGTWS